MLSVGGNVIEGRTVGLSINGSVVIGARAPLAGDVDWLLTGSFCDNDGRQTLSFEDNEIRIATGSWDVELAGPRLTVRQGPGIIVAEVHIDADLGRLSVERLSMGLAGQARLEVTRDSLAVRGPNHGYEFTGCFFSGSGTLVQIGPPLLVPSNFSTIAVNVPSLGTFVDWINSPSVSLTG